MNGDIIPSSRPSIYDVIPSLSKLGDGRAIVRPDNPPVGIAGFIFDIDDETEMALRSEITDHWTEENVAIQDHIALLPEEITVRGLVAEVVAVQEEPGATPAQPGQALPINLYNMPVLRQAQAQAMTNSQTLSNVLQPGQTQSPAVGQALSIPQDSVGAVTEQQAQDISFGYGVPAAEARKLANAQLLAAANKSAAEPTASTSALSSAFSPPPSSLYQMYTNVAGAPPEESRQAGAAGYFYQLWWGRQLVTVETPWGIMTDMAIQSVRVVQTGESKYQSELIVAFKRIRTTGAAQVTAGQLAGRLSQQNAEPVNNGVAGKTDIPEEEGSSILYSMTQPP